MYATALIGVDDSQSEAALSFAVQWLRRENALFTGFTVVDLPSLTASEPTGVAGTELHVRAAAARLAQARAAATKALDRFARGCIATSVPYKLLSLEGSPVDVLVEHAQRYDVLVVRRDTRFLFASQEGPDQVLTQSLRLSPRPIVVVPDRLPAGRNVVIAYDGSVQAARALQAFQCSGFGASAPVHIVGLGDDHVATAKKVDHAVEFLRFHGRTAWPRIATPGASPHETLLEQARSLGAGLLVAGCYGRSAFFEFFLGSTTRGLLESSDLPLFLYH